MNELVPFPPRHKVALSPTSLTIDGALSEQDLGRCWEFVRNASKSVMWWIGDLAQYEERTAGGYLVGGWYNQKAKDLELAKATIREAASVAGRMKSSIRIDDLPWAHHKIIADAFADPDIQSQWLRRARDEKLTQRELRKAIGDSRPGAALPPGKYRVIYADPPWEYGTPQHSTQAQETVLESHYPTMSLEKIQSLPVSGLATDNAVLFLWITVPLLRDGLSVLDAWGFEYKTHFVWDKVGHNVGYYISVRHELLLIATRGSCLPDGRRLYDSVQSIERTEHSAKPPKFRQIIDSLYHPPEARHDRIELFPRGHLPPGWDGWGYEYQG